jgi:hypothetical protein
MEGHRGRAYLYLDRAGFKLAGLIRFFVNQEENQAAA